MAAAGDEDLESEVRAKLAVVKRKGGKARKGSKAKLEKQLAAIMKTKRKKAKEAKEAREAAKGVQHVHDFLFPPSHTCMCIYHSIYLLKRYSHTQMASGLWYRDRANASTLRSSRPSPSLLALHAPPALLALLARLALLHDER